MIWKTIQVVATSVIPKIAEDLYKYLTTEDKKVDRTIYTPEQVTEIVAMWKAWKDNPALYPNQNRFAEAVNTRFNTNKSTATIVKLVKKSL